MLLQGLLGISDCYRLLSIAIDYYPLSQSITIDNNFFSVSSIVIDYYFDLIIANFAIKYLYRYVKKLSFSVKLKFKNVILYYIIYTDPNFTIN